MAEIAGLTDPETRSAKLDAVLHNPQFQALESAWRGLHFALTRGASDKVRFEILPADRAQVLERFEETVFEGE